MGALWLKLFLVLASLSFAGAAAASGVTPQQCGLRIVQSWIAGLSDAGKTQLNAPLVRLTALQARNRPVRPVPNEAVPSAAPTARVAALCRFAQRVGPPQRRYCARPASGRSPPSHRHT